MEETGSGWNVQHCRRLDVIITGINGVRGGAKGPKTDQYYRYIFIFDNNRITIFDFLFLVMAA